MKRIIPVPKTTIPYKCGERYMACELKANHNKKTFEVEHCIEFFKDKDSAIDYALENNIYMPIDVDNMEFQKI